MSAASPSLVDLCRAQGRRITGQRKIIAEVISAARDHPDVPEIHQRALQIDARISLSTVYRTLRIFSEFGLIAQHSFEGGRFRVEKAEGPHHDHLIDIESGGVIEFRSDEIERLQTEIARKLGYELTGHRLELYGRRIKEKRSKT
jgi:Fur family transcriptional regulator, ferric uptake regulator